jgi:hypothetical protein
MHNKYWMDLIRLLSNISFLIFFFCILSTCSVAIATKQVVCTTETVNNSTQKIIISFDVSKKDFIYKEFISFSANHPTVTLSEWKTNVSPVTYYDPLFKNTKQIFNKSFTIIMHATTNQPIKEPVHIYCTYYQRSEKKIKQIIFTFSFTHPPSTEEVSPLLTHLETDVQPKKIKPDYVSPFDYYLSTTLCNTRSYLKLLKNTYGSYFLLALVLIFICLMSSYFFTHTLVAFPLFTELISVMRSLTFCVMCAYTLCYVRTLVPLYVFLSLTTAYSLIVGIFYTKKSTQLRSGYLCTFCSFIGIFLITATVFLLFKTLQTV